MLQDSVSDALCGKTLYCLRKMGARIWLAFKFFKWWATQNKLILNYFLAKLSLQGKQGNCKHY